jgi:protein-L-isoaspartate(D-aspartate) O-methyltransferase
MYKTTTLLALLAFMAGALSGCGGCGNQRGSTVPATASPPAGQQPAEKAKEKPSEEESYRYSEGLIGEREKMIREHLVTRGVVDNRVLSVMSNVPRELFVPANLRRRAYEDGPLPIGYGQTISQPYIVGYMTQLLEVDPHLKVLEIGTGSGYQAALLAAMAADVYSIEIVPELCAEARKRLKELDYDVKVRCGNGYEGWPEEAPFDRIIGTAAPEEIPETLIEQLAEGGRLVLPVGGRSQEIWLVLKREDGEIIKERKLPVVFVPMVGKPTE